MKSLRLIECKQGDFNMLLFILNSTGNVLTGLQKSNDLKKYRIKFVPKYCLNYTVNVKKCKVPELLNSNSLRFSIKQSKMCSGVPMK